MVVYMTGEALQQSLDCVLADPLVDEARRRRQRLDADRGVRG